MNRPANDNDENRGPLGFFNGLLIAVALALPIWFVIFRLAGWI